ncbi:MAG: NlpC/P60 family protein [Pseudomonadota bacterium]
MPSLDDPRLATPAGDGTRYQVTAGVAAIRAEPKPDAAQVTQALHGETVNVFQEAGEFGLVQLVRDGYVGWTLMAALSAPLLSPTHKVTALRTYVYSEPDLKSAPRYMICLGARVVVEEANGPYRLCARAGWVHERHLSPLDIFEGDPADVALRYLHTPYLWGGRESLGLDCTGLTQQAFEVCGVALPRDSDMQFAWSGESIEDWEAAGALGRGDLVFWKGHVGIMLDPRTLLHANANHMAVAAEPLSEAVRRIASHYGEPIGARRIDLDQARGAAPHWLNLKP